MEEFKLDEKDRKILVELQKNSRASFSKIGKIVKLPKTVVAYRVKRFVDSGFINLFCTVINKDKLNYIKSKLYLKFHNFDNETEKKLTSYLKGRKGMHRISSLNGCYDFCIHSLSKNIEKLNETNSQIIYKFNKYILEKDLSIVVKERYNALNYVFAKNIKPEVKKTNTDLDFKVRKTDIKIINLIKQNSRIPLLEISEKLKISPQTIRARIKELLNNRIIYGFRIRINPKLLGLHHFITFINFSKADEKKEKEITDFILSLPSSIQVSKSIGKYDLEFESLAKSHFELYEIINKIKNQFPENILHSDSVLIYKIHDINTVNYEI